MAEEELSKLSLNLKQIQKKFIHEWKGELENQIDEKTAKHNENLEKGEGNIAECERKIRQYNDESQKKLEVLQQQADEVSSLEKQLRELQICASTLLKRKEEEEKLLEEKERLLEREEQEIKVKEEATSYKLKQFVMGTKFFEERLALSFKKIDEDHLQFVFKCVDPNDWEKAFFFTVSVDSNKLYTVKDCVPHVDDLESMVEELNKTDNFSKFVISMRKKFKGTI